MDRFDVTPASAFQPAPISAERVTGFLLRRLLNYAVLLALAAIGI